MARHRDRVGEKRAPCTPSHYCFRRSRSRPSCVIDNPSARARSSDAARWMFYEAPSRPLFGETRVGLGQHVTATSKRPTKHNFQTVETRPSARGISGEKTRRKSALFSSLQKRDKNGRVKTDHSRARVDGSLPAISYLGSARRDKTMSPWGIRSGKTNRRSVFSKTTNRRISVGTVYKVSRMRLVVFNGR